LSRRFAFLKAGYRHDEITSLVFVSQAFVIVCLCSSEVWPEIVVAAERRRRAGNKFGTPRVFSAAGPSSQGPPPNTKKQGTNDMIRTALAAAAMLVVCGSAFAGSDHYGADNANQPAAGVDQTPTASFQTQKMAHHQAPAPAASSQTAADIIARHNDDSLWGR
jgi:hypothetical protein